MSRPRPVPEMVPLPQAGVISRAALADMDGGPTTRNHWKTLFVTGMGFFTDAYDLFIIGIVASMAGPPGMPPATRSRCCPRSPC